MATYLNLIQRFKNIRDAISEFEQTGYRNSYLTRSYINSLIKDIDQYILNTNWTINNVDKLYYLRRIERILFGIKRINAFFSDDTIDNNYSDLMNAISDNFVLLPI